MNETELKRYVRHERLTCWSESYEPSLRGGGIGIPDVQVLLVQRLFPIEMKLGYVKDRRLYAYRVRPAQISWHARFSRAGGIAMVCVGVDTGERHPLLYIIPGGAIGKLRDGMFFGQDTYGWKCITPTCNLDKKLVDFINEEWNGVLRPVDKRRTRA